MGNDAENRVGMRVIQLDVDTYAIQHPCILAPMNTVRTDEDFCIVYPNQFAPIAYPAKLLNVWQEGDVLYLQVWNYYKDKMEMYLQDLSKDESLFLFVSMPFISQLLDIMINKRNLEFSVINNLSITSQI
jgi:hypothetical protein